MSTATAINTGKVVQVIGSTLDAEFDVLPAIYKLIGWQRLARSLVKQRQPEPGVGMQPLPAT